MPNRTQVETRLGSKWSNAAGKLSRTMIPFSALFIAATLRKDRTETLGYRYAQILEIGPKRWEELTLEKRGPSTLATAGGFSVYGDALAWRNDRLLKGRAFPLRGHLRSFSIQAQEVGNTVTGGGTIWAIFAGQSHRDVEAAIHTVLTHNYRGPHRVVSDVTKAIDRLGWEARRAEGKDRSDAQKAMRAIRRDLRLVVSDARRLSRRDSDAALDFCRTTALAVVEQVTPK